MDQKANPAVFSELESCNAYGCRVVIDVTRYHAPGNTIFELYAFLDSQLGADNWRIYRIEKRSRAYIGLRDLKTLQRVRELDLVLYNSRSRSDFKPLTPDNRFTVQFRPAEPRSLWVLWVCAHTEEPGMLRRKITSPDFNQLHDELARRLDGPITISRTDEIATTTHASNAPVYKILTADPNGRRRTTFIQRHNLKTLFVTLLRYEKTTDYNFSKAPDFG